MSERKTMEDIELFAFFLFCFQRFDQLHTVEMNNYKKFKNKVRSQYKEYLVLLITWYDCYKYETT